MDFYTDEHVTMHYLTTDDDAPETTAMHLAYWDERDRPLTFPVEPTKDDRI